MKFVIPLAIIVCALPAHAQNPLSVSVLNEAGQPIAGALVTAEIYAEGAKSIKPQTTGADGKATFSLPNNAKGNPEAATVTAGARGYSFNGTGGLSGLKAGPLEIRLSRGQSWRGKVVDETGAPLAGAQISIYGASKHFDFGHSLFIPEEVFQTLYGAKSKADGTFEIADLPADKDLYYHVKLPGFAPLDSQSGRVDDSPTFKLLRSGAMRGRALDVAGAPLAGAQVFATSPLAISALIKTDAAGAFSLEGLPPGVYELHGEVPKGAPFLMPRLKGVRVEVATTATAPDWRAIAGVEIRGLVRDAISKKPVEGASFAAQNKADEKSGDDSAWATSDKTGHFILRVLPGDYRVRVGGNAPGYLVPDTIRSAQPREGTPAQISFELQTANVVRGTTRDESGAPIQAQLLVGSFGQTLDTNAQGNWQYEPRNNNDVTFGGGEDDKGYFEIVSPKRVDWPVKGPIVVTVRRHPWQSLAGRVVTPDGAPVEGAKITARFLVALSDSMNRGGQSSALSDKDGRYVLERLRDSRQPNVGGTEVEVSAKKDGYQFQSGGKVTRVGKEPRVSDLVFAPLSEKLEGTTQAGADVVVAGRQTRADDAGRFSFDALPAGKNVIYAAKDDLFGSAPSSQNPLEIKLSKLAPQGQDETLAREIWGQAMEGKPENDVANLDDWRKGDDFVTQLRRAQKSGEPDQIGYALGQLKPTDSPEAQTIAREVLSEMAPTEARTGAYLQMAVGNNDANLTERALELAKAQFDATPTDARTRENQLYLASVLTERRDGADAGAFALRSALAYTLQTHPVNSRVEGAMQTEVGRNEALANVASVVAQGSPALLRELLENIDAGSGFAIRARANAVPVVERTRGFAAAAPLLEELRQMPEPTLDLKIRYMDFTPAWAYGQAVSNLIPIIGPTNPSAALELARKVEGDDEQRGRALARAARYQSLDVAAPMLREAALKISSEDAPRVADAAYERDQKLGLELFEVARQKADDDMKSDRNWRNAWISFAFGYAQANPAGARLILEREWAKSREAKADDDVLAATAIAMAPIDGQRAAEMARKLGGSWGFDAQVKIARYLIADDATRHGFVLNRIGSREGWDAGELQW